MTEEKIGTVRGSGRLEEYGNDSVLAELFALKLLGKESLFWLSGEDMPVESRSDSRVAA